MTVSSGLSQPTAILNTALIDDGLGRILPRQVAAFVNDRQIFLPLIRR